MYLQLLLGPSGFSTATLNVGGLEEESLESGIWVNNNAGYMPASMVTNKGDGI